MYFHILHLQICVRTLTGATYTLQVTTRTTVGDVKVKVRDLSGRPVHMQRLIYAGVLLDDERKLGEYDVENEATLHQLLK